MKKIISVITLTAAILSLTSCGGGSTKNEEGAGIEKLV